MIEEKFYRGDTFDQVVDVGRVEGWSRDDVLAVLRDRQWDLDGSGRLPRSKRLTSPAGLRNFLTAPPRPPAASVRASPPASSEPAPELAAEDLVAEPQSPPAGPRRRPINHGSPGGLRAHARRGDPVPDDDPCGCRKAHKEAQARHQRNHYLKKRAAAGHPPERPAPAEPEKVLDPAAATPASLPARRSEPALPPIPHGTVDGYHAHLDRGALPVCDDCRAAIATIAASLSPPPGNAATGPTLSLLHPTAVDLDVWFGAGQLSPCRPVRRAAHAASTALRQLHLAMEELARTERATSASRSTGGPA